MAELEDKYGQEISQEVTKFELLREEKNDLEMESQERQKQQAETHANVIQQLEGNFQHRMMVEVGRYQKLVAERDAKHREWQAEHANLMKQHQSEREQALNAEDLSRNADTKQKERIEDEKLLAERVHKETLHQLEQDTDREIAELRSQFDEKLKNEKDDKVRLRGQAGIHR